MVFLRDANAQTANSSERAKYSIMHKIGEKSNQNVVYFSKNSQFVKLERAKTKVIKMEFVYVSV